MNYSSYYNIAFKKVLNIYNYYNKNSDQSIKY